MLNFSFLYGLCTAIEVSFGITKYSTRKFAVLNGIGALVWAALLGSLGYLFGHGIEAMLGNIKRDEIWLFATVIFIGWFAMTIAHTHGLSGAPSTQQTDMSFLQRQHRAECAALVCMMLCGLSLMLGAVWMS